MSNLTPVPFQLSDGDTGLPLAFAKMSFTLTGTTTPSPVYTTAALDTAHTDPVVADDAGIFPDIFLDPDIVYRMRLILADGDFATPLIDHDPINELPLELTPELIETALGYVPVNPADAQFTGEARLAYTAPLEILHSDSVGYRGRPVRITDASHTLALDDAGNLLLKDDTSTPNVTIDTNANVPFPTGTVIYLMNVNTGAVTILRESGVELRIAGSATNQDVTLAQWGQATLIKYDTNKWQVHGTGLT